MLQWFRNRYSRVILITACVLLFFNNGSRFAFSVLLKPMEEDLRWSRGSLSLAATMFMIVSSVTMPVVGQLADKYGFRATLLATTVLASVGLGLVGSVDQKWQLFLLYGGMFAVGNGGTSISPIGVMVSLWHRNGRGMANSVAIAGGAVGQLVMISLLSSLLLDLGWRWAYRIFAFAVIGATLPLILFLVRPAPSGSKPAPKSMEREKESSIGPVLSSPKFISMFIMFSICGFQDWLVGTHVVAFATDEGIGPVLAGNLLALMGVMGLIGVLLSGYLSDTFGPSRPTMMCFLLRTGIFSLVIISTSTPAILAFALLYGFTFLMTAPLTPVFIARFYGIGQLGALTGIINMVHQMSGGLGAYVGGVVFDSFGSYQWAFVMAFALSIVAAITTLSLRDPRVPHPA